MQENSLASFVYGEIRKKILANQLTGDSRLAENTWATKLEVSRVAVREALIRLSGEGLVEFGEKGGCFVRSITTEDGERDNAGRSRFVSGFFVPNTPSTGAHPGFCNNKFLTNRGLIRTLQGANRDLLAQDQSARRAPEDCL